MFYQILSLQLILFSSNIVATTLSTVTLLEDIHENSDISTAAQCLNIKPYDFAAAYQGSILTCITKTKIFHSATTEELLLIERCVATNMQKTKSIDKKRWGNCYENGQLNKIMQRREKYYAEAEKVGAEKMGEIFVPKKACRIKTIENEYFDIDDGDIFIRKGIELAVTGAGDDGIGVLVGTSSADISNDLDEYKVLNCPRNFLEAIGAYSYEEQSSYNHAEFTVQDVHLYKDNSQTTNLCTISQGSEIDDALYRVDEQFLDEIHDLDYEPIFSKVIFDRDATYCAGMEGYMNTGLFISFVIPPELGFLDSISELPKCTEEIEMKSAFILKDMEGPDLRTCRLSYSQQPNQWCGKKFPEGCIEN